MKTLARILVPGLAVAALGTLAGASPSFAMSAQECSTKYQDAKKAGTLNGLKWNDFRKKECAGAGSDDEPKTEAKTTAPKPVVKPKKEAKAKAVTPAAAGSAVFPKAVDPKYAKESAGKARMHTCLDQYNANKATSGNGGHKWIEKGGGYYSLCNSALKG